jgi:hypothetical protein
MSREAHVQFCESLGVRFPGATHLVKVLPPSIACQTASMPDARIGDNA